MYDRGSEGVPSQKAQGLSVSRCLRVFVLQTLYAHPGGRSNGRVGWTGYRNSIVLKS